MIINFSNIGSGSGSGGVTTGQVMDMISELAQGYYTASTLSAITSPKEGDVCIVSEVITQITSTTPSYVNDFFALVSGKKLKVDLNTEGITSNTYCKFSINNNADYWGFGYSGGTFVTMSESENNWITGWTGSDYIHTFPEISSVVKMASSNMSNLWPKATFTIVEENVAFTYLDGEWIRLLDTVYEIAQGIVDISVEKLNNKVQTVLNYTNWSGHTPSETGSLEGSILTYNGVYGEAFKGEDSFLERKGFYNRTFTGTTDLSATTGNEGDIYTKITQTTGETAWTAMSAEEFAATCSGNTGWEAGVTYKFVADTAVTPASEGQFAYSINQQEFGVGYKDGAYVKWDENQEGNWVAWDGSEIIVSIPDPVTSRSNRWRNNTSAVTTFVTASTLEAQITTTVDSYEMIYGDWCPRYKHVVMSQGDYESLQTKDPHTIYNITGTTS